MSDDPPRCFHCGQPIPDGEGWRENGILFASREHADDWLAWLASQADGERGTAG